MKSRSGFVLAVFLVTVLLAAGQASAKTTWLCSLSTAVACDEDGTIGPPDLGGLERPTFLRVDVDSRKVTMLGPESRRGEVTIIDTVFEGDGIWVFTGVEAARAWSLVISKDGHLTLSVATDGAVWSAFGNALRE